MSKLNAIDEIHISTVLEDCVDQLAILGHLMPLSFQHRSNKNEIVANDVREIFGNQKQIENSYTNAVSLDRTGSAKARNLDLAQNAGKDLRLSMQAFRQSLKQNPLTADNFEKIQADRAFLEQVLYGTMLEIADSKTYNILSEAVGREQENRTQLEETIRSEQESRRKVKQLQKKLVEVKKEKEIEVQKRREMIAHLKDQVQEMKAKTNMEGKYIKKVTDVSIAQMQKKCSLIENKTQLEIQELKAKLDEENRVSNEIESFLRAHIRKRQDLMQHWMDKYDTDILMKQKELDMLKLAKAKDLERLQELRRLYLEYEQVVVEDRVEKEKARRKADMEADELDAVIKIQCWWRGVMVRRCLGPYKKKKKKGGKGKGKKGSSGKKGKNK